METRKTPLISYSMRSDFKRCPRLVFFRHVAGIEPRAPATALAIGQAFHVGLEYWRNGGEDPIAHAVAKIQSSMTEMEVDADTIAVESARLTAYLTGYMARFESDMGGHFDVERELTDSIETGFIDALWNDPLDGSTWIIEDKTRTQLTQNLNYILPMNEQLLTYMVLCKKHGIDVAGCLYRETKKTQTRPKKDESVDEYCERVIDIYKTDYENLYSETRITFDNSAVEKYELEMDHMNGALQMCFSRMPNFEQWGFNSNECAGKYGTCKMAQICATCDDQIGRMYRANDKTPIDGGAFQKRIWGFVPAKPV